MNKKVLLTEYFELCPNNVCEDLLTEAEREMRKNGTTFLTGKIQEAEVVNGNNRVYRKNTLKKEVERYIREEIKNNKAVGSTDHRDIDIVELSNASHMFTNMWMEGNSVYGTCKVLTTDAGKNLQALINDGVSLGMSSRAIGSLTESSDGGPSVVNDDLLILCWDIVQTPSTPNAYMTLSESQIKQIESKYFTKSDKLRRILNDIVRK